MVNCKKYYSTCANV